MNTKKRFYLRVSAVFISIALIALFSLIGCEYFVDPSGEVGTSGSAPVIAANTQLTLTAATISIAVSGGLFDMNAAIVDFDFDPAGTYPIGNISVATGTASPTATTFTFALSALPNAGETIMIRALPTAFTPVASTVSNRVTFTAVP